MNDAVRKLKERAQTPGEVFSRGEMLTAIETAEYFAREWEKEGWARIDWKEQCRLNATYLQRAIELLRPLNGTNPEAIRQFLKELKKVGLASNPN